MSLAIVTAIRANYPTPLGTRHLEFLEAVARATGLGLCRRTEGTYVPHPIVGGVSQDIVMNKTGDAWDCLIDGENTARPCWVKKSPEDTPSPDRYVVVLGTPPPDDPSDPDQPPPGEPDWELIIGALEDLSSALEAVEAQAVDIERRLDTQGQILARLVELVTALEPVVFPAYAGKVFGLPVILRPQAGG